MALRLHWSPDSANLAPRIALERAGLAYEAVRVDRASGGHKRPAYLALNPQGLIPVLEDGPVALFETGAILLHLAERDGRIADDAARAALLRWVFYLSNTLHADLRIAFYPHRYALPAAQPALQAHLARRVAEHLDLLEAAVTREGTLCAASPVADDYLAVCVRWAQLYPLATPPAPDALARRPALRELLERLEKETPVLRACRAEAIPGDRPFTAPRPPDLPEAEVTGGAA